MKPSNTVLYSALSQDPEMMREAQKMMEDPAFQSHMDKLMGQKGMKQALKKTKKQMSDPKKAAELEAKAKMAIAEGEKELDKLSEQKKASESKPGANDAERKESAAGDDPKQSSDVDLKSTATAEQDKMPDIPALNLN